MVARKARDEWAHITNGSKDTSFLNCKLVVLFTYTHHYFIELFVLCSILTHTVTHASLCLFSLWAAWSVRTCTVFVLAGWLDIISCSYRSILCSECNIDTAKTDRLLFLFMYWLTLCLHLFVLETAPGNVKHTVTKKRHSKVKAQKVYCTHGFETSSTLRATCIRNIRLACCHVSQLWSHLVEHL